MAQSITGLSTEFKALKINEDKAKYGSFAEIGAGQEVARHFFQAGRASHTIAKSMSAYDMVFSDEIYGKEESGRYVCESRLQKMLDHEFALMNERLSEQKGKESKFFAFANTVATNRGHGWVGIRYQLEPLGPAHNIILHIKMLDTTRLQQAEVLGVLGVNLIYGAYQLHQEREKFICSLTDNISQGRMEIDLIKFEGPDFKNVDNRLMCLELVKQGLTPNVVFNSNGDNSTLSEEFFRKSVFLMRGEFRPITKINMEILNKGFEEFKKDFLAQDSVESQALLEISMAFLKQEKGSINNKDFLERVETLAHLKYPVMISNYAHHYELKKALREVTKEPLGMVIGGNHLDYFFKDNDYNGLDGGYFEASANLFDEKTCVYIYPYKSQESCMSLATYFPDATTDKLLSFLKERTNIKDISNCNEVESSVLSSKVRELLLQGDPSWEQLVPEGVKELIMQKGLFRSKS